MKEGAVVIDVGVNRIGMTPEGKAKLCGDVDFDGVKEKASAITPLINFGLRIADCGMFNIRVNPIPHSEFRNPQLIFKSNPIFRFHFFILCHGDIETDQVGIQFLKGVGVREHLPITRNRLFH